MEISKEIATFQMEIGAIVDRVRSNLDAAVKRAEQAEQECEVLRIRATEAENLLKEFYALKGNLKAVPEGACEHNPQLHHRVAAAWAGLEAFFAQPKEEAKRVDG